MAGPLYIMWLETSSFANKMRRLTLSARCSLVLISAFTETLHCHHNARLLLSPSVNTWHQRCTFRVSPLKDLTTWGLFAHVCGHPDVFVVWFWYNGKRHGSLTDKLELKMIWKCPLKMIPDHHILTLDRILLWNNAFSFPFILILMGLVDWGQEMMLRKEGLGSGNAKPELLSPTGMYYSVRSGVKKIL